MTHFLGSDSGDVAGATGRLRMRHFHRDDFGEQRTMVRGRRCSHQDRLRIYRRGSQQFERDQMLRLRRGKILGKIRNISKSLAEINVKNLHFFEIS